MDEHSPTGATADVVVVCANEQDDVEVDPDRWAALAEHMLTDLGCRGELTLTFVDEPEIAALNIEHMGHDGATDVLSFPLDAQDSDHDGNPAVPSLLGDVVVCPAVAAAQAGDHAGTVDDELALLIVHGLLHIVGWDHADPDAAAAMRRREHELLTRWFWQGPPPPGFRHDHQDQSR